MKARMSWANRVTLARIVLIPVFVAILLAQLQTWGPWLAAGVFTLLAATDGVDGYLARSRGEVTTFGKFIDPLADKLLVTAALLALVELGKLSAWIALVIVSRELVVSGLRMVAVAEGKVIAASSFGKTKTVFQIAAIVGFIVKDTMQMPMLFGRDGAEVFGALSWAVMGTAIVLTIVSAVDYFRHARDVITGPWTREQAKG